MVIIKFPDGIDWFKANWVFRRLVEDVGIAFPQKRDLVARMERAQGIGAFILNEMDADSSSEAMDAMRLVAQGTIGGEIPGWRRTHPDDENGQRQYVESMKGLLTLIMKQTRRA